MGTGNFSKDQRILAILVIINVVVGKLGPWDMDVPKVIAPDRQCDIKGHAMDAALIFTHKGQALTLSTTL